jgi:hypothetical protein
MRIESFFPNSNLFSESPLTESLLKEGSIIEGSILDVFDNTVILDVKKLGIIKADSSINLEHFKGHDVKFIIKDISSGKIEIFPMTNQNEDLSTGIMPSNIKEDYISRILKDFNVQEDNVTRNFVENLLKFNIPIEKNIVSRGIKIIDKLDHILNLNNDEEVTIAKPTNDILKEDISKFIIVDKNENMADKNENIVDNNLLHTAENENLGDSTLNDVLHNTCKDPNNIFSNKAISENLIKSIIFLLKNNMKVSISNLSYLNKIVEGEDIFFEDFQKIKEHIPKLKNINFNNIKISLFDNNSESFNEYHSKFNEKIQEINEQISKIDFTNKKELKDSLERLNSKIEFINEINKEMAFLYIPFRINDDQEKGILSMMKKNGKISGNNNKVSVYISLNTKFIDTVKILCDIYNNSINLKINIKEENISLFISQEDKLRHSIEEKGYILKNIEYSDSSKSIGLYDALIVSNGPFYFLDMRV